MHRRKFMQFMRNLGLASSFATLGFTGTSLSAMAANNTPNAATAHIDAMIVDMMVLLEIDTGDMAARRESVTALLKKYFDFPGIARFSAGQYWRAATDAEKREYESIIHEVIVGTVVNNFDQLKGLKYTPVSSTAKGEKLAIVSGEFSDRTGARPSVLVNWRVTTVPGEPIRVLDIEIENISMLITQKQENIAIIRKNKGKFSALIDAMKTKLEG